MISQPSGMDPTAMRSWLADRDVSAVDCCFVDMWGVIGGRRLPVEHFVKIASTGISMPLAPFLWSIRAEIEPMPAANPANGYPNAHLVPDLASLRQSPWEPAAALCFMNAFVESGGPPSPFDTRNLLREQVAAFESSGCRARVASELEFYLCNDDWSLLHDERRAFSMTQGAMYEHVIGEVRRNLATLDIEVESSQTEYGPGQWEINVSPSDPVRMADGACLIRYTVKRVARKHGLRATFMPLPFQSQSASGHHIHINAHDRAGRPLFNVDHAELNQPMSAFLAGVLAPLGELTAVFLPTVNAYKRLADYSFAPNRVCWSFDNRTTAVRIPPSRGENTRLEVRVASADANANLVIAAILAGGRNGLTCAMTAPNPMLGDAYQATDLERLPSNLGAALDAFASSAFAIETFGADFVDARVRLGRREVAAFESHITDWERERYLDAC